MTHSRVNLFLREEPTILADIINVNLKKLETSRRSRGCQFPELDVSKSNIAKPKRGIFPADEGQRRLENLPLVSVKAVIANDTWICKEAPQGS